MFGSSSAEPVRRAARRGVQRGVVRGTIVAAAVALTTTLGACGGMPGTAATVDGQKISDTEVTKAVESYNSIVPEGQQKMTAPAALNELVKADLADELMRERGLSTAEFDQFYEEGVNPQLKDDEEISSLARELLKTPFIASKIGEQEVQQAYSSAKVEVNPRYGTWGEGKLNPDSGSLSVPSQAQGK